MRRGNFGWYLLLLALGAILAGGSSESVAALLAGAAICFQLERTQGGE